MMVVNGGGGCGAKGGDSGWWITGWVFVFCFWSKLHFAGLIKIMFCIQSFKKWFLYP